ncbi:DUF3923 family protein [Loigolactobacillus jiayinensis]|uniref:DUF3923 family protein n=1 Tax=Loigolactobacillus jiayinensis TaxID=2486016 RepID=A0ABW1RCI9_9LACO|nr:DUF3923 family protein [Loigolactobacillus jiayinensis]
MMHLKNWWIMNGFGLVLFLSSLFLVSLRRVDGAGVQQTPLAKMIAFTVVVVFFLVGLIVQLSRYRRLRSQQYN